MSVSAAVMTGVDETVEKASACLGAAKAGGCLHYRLGSREAFVGWGRETAKLRG